ncbi:5-(carboxyamino)imidazole ribonucleotide mutase [Desulfosoma caldarium]|uniref:N5-carboxyaminoimidazole ribonucleotide mutase n=2 Tax=Desulfosoma caldarium TaxID=610254 RepID=A0A3N1UUS2_9BACT|nr:5-(carboxyamino)imidazole ribonucleotide mutase [Desulfosoma caldarium]
MTTAKKPLVGVLMGSDSDLPVMEGAFEVLRKFGVPFEAAILSAHRTPEQAAQYAATAAERGLQVIIAAAGWAAHLAGVLASKTILPVIGVPVDSSPLHGMDALLSTVQMPPGIPVATMAIGQGGARNAALFAVQILALCHDDLTKALKRYRADMAAEVLAKNAKVDASVRVEGL